MKLRTRGRRTGEHKLPETGEEASEERVEREGSHELAVCKLNKPREDATGEERVDREHARRRVAEILLHDAADKLLQR